MLNENKYKVPINTSPENQMLFIVNGLEQKVKARDKQIAELQEKLSVVDKLWKDARSDKAQQHNLFSKEVTDLKDKLHWRNLLIKSKYETIKRLQEQVVNLAVPKKVVRILNRVNR